MSVRDNRCAPVTLFDFHPSRACATLSTCPGETLGMVVEVADIVMGIKVDMVAGMVVDMMAAMVAMRI